MSHDSTTETPLTEASNLDAKALDRFSRQNAALGAETTAKLTKMKVLIYGMKGLGIETAKNLVLQGVGAISIVDPNAITIQDTGLNFFLHEEDVGKVRADVVLPRLQELNPTAILGVKPDLSDEVVLSHTALVITSPLPIPELTRLNHLCRENRVGFFIGISSGLSTSVFVDLGEHHVVNDPNGDRPVQKLITLIKSIDGSDETLIRYETPEGQQPVALSSGHFDVTEVQGINGINHLFPVTHSYSDPVKTVRIPFKIPEGEAYVSGGILTEKKLPTPHPMASLASKIKNPGDTFSEPPSLVLTDLINFGSETQQHVAFVSALTFLERNGTLPRPGNDDDAEALITLSRELLSNGTFDLPDFDVDTAFFKIYSKYVGVELQPVSAFLGGVLAQEVVKCSGKFTPIPGFLHFSAREALPDEAVSEADRAPRGSRYDNLASVYGWSFVEKLGNLKYFMVGCGALGCEFMKNFALNGVCCGPDGNLTVTDPDRIELSNLSRQFLFREHNVGQCKATAATAMASVMNKDIKVTCFEQFVGPKTEGVFNDEFWMNLDGVCNALDNMEARLFVDKQCVKYEKSLLESGTMGTSGNIDTISPFKTRTYADGGNAAEGGGVPMCTLRNFPHLTDHCIEWARDQFELLFTKLAKTSEAYLRDAAGFEEEKRSKVETETGAAIFDIRALTSILRAAKNRTVGSCAQAAFDLFHFLFRDKILDLQAAFPPNARLIEKGEDKGPFWGEKKRYPTAGVFNLEDEYHVNFLRSTTTLFASMIGLIPSRNPEDSTWAAEFRETNWIQSISSDLTVPEYIQAPVSSADLEGLPEVPKEFKQELADRLLGELRGISSGLDGRSFDTADFEKDDDLNFHIEFITAAANCRCDNYSINKTDFQSCKIIAGKIIAAIATTTAAVCGLVILELFKLILNKPTDAYMNRAIGLAANTFTSFTQEPPKSFKTYTEVTTPDDLPADAYDEKGKVKDEFLEKKVKKAYPENHTTWSKIVCAGSLNIREFIGWLQTEHNLKMQQWDFVYGVKNDQDKEGQKIVKNFTFPIYPFPLVLDHSLLPTLDLAPGQAMQQIMRNPACPSTLKQKYHTLWKEFKAAGAIPPTPPSDHPFTESTTLVEILRHMSHLGEVAEHHKAIDSKVVSSLEGRRFWVISSDQIPQCTDAETGDEIENMCALKITL